MPFHASLRSLLLAERFDQARKELQADRENAHAAAMYALARRQEGEARLKLTETRKRLNGWST